MQTFAGKRAFRDLRDTLSSEVLKTLRRDLKGVKSGTNR
jgi:hypothetical protein